MPPKRLLDGEKKPAVLVQGDSSSAAWTAPVSDLDTNHAATRKVTVTPIPQTAEFQNKKGHFVYYKAIIYGNNRHSQTSRIEVEEGDVIATIKKRIRNVNPSFDLSQMKLYKFEDLVEPLNPFGIVWNENVNWGTIENPLIVNVRRFERPQLQNNNAGVTKSPWSGECKHPLQKENGDLFVKSIMKDYENIQGGATCMSVLKNVVDLESDSTRDVVLRSNTEDFWQEVITSTSKNRVCAVGTPGIGKTTITCILIRLLLQQNVTVIYHILTTRNDGYVYMFTPISEEPKEIDVNVIAEKYFMYGHTEVNMTNTYYVADPGQTMEVSCNINNAFLGKVIIVASPNSKHWGGSDFRKERGASLPGLFLNFPVWTLDELIAAKQYFKYNLDDEKIINRYEQVGGVPRHIFTDDATFNGILRELHQQ